MRQIVSLGWKNVRFWEDVTSSLELVVKIRLKFFENLGLLVNVVNF